MKNTIVHLNKHKDLSDYNLDEVREKVEVVDSVGNDGSVNLVSNRQHFTKHKSVNISFNQVYGYID